MSHAQEPAEGSQERDQGRGEGRDQDRSEGRDQDQSQDRGEGGSQVHDYYGVPLWLMKEYLGQLGAAETVENVMVGDGWRAELRKADPRHIGSLVVGGTTATFAGEAAALEAMFARLHWKTLRGGG